VGKDSVNVSFGQRQDDAKGSLPKTGKNSSRARDGIRFSRKCLTCKRNQVRNPLFCGTSRTETLRKSWTIQEKTGGKGSKVEIEARRLQVLRLYLRGMKGDEIAHELNCPRSTIYRDIDNLKQWPKVNFDEQRMIAVIEAGAKVDEIWRELWQTFYKPSIGNEDPSFRKMATIDRMLKVLHLRTYLLAAWT